MFDLLKRGRKAEVTIDTKLLVKLLLIVVLAIALFGMIYWVASRFKPY